MANRLSASTSPYLLQHADNPVDWFEWGDEATAEAERRGVPILLSVGYSACHWCHVMAHESFEDPDTASEMNQLFVNVKVDREERPDVDSVYMEAVQAMVGQGGWPMTVWLTPTGEPFFAGTYFPKADRPGLPSFRRVMAAVSDAWSNRRSDVTEQAARITAALAAEGLPEAQLPDVATLTKAHDALNNHLDQVNGGFGSAPKFPQAPTLEFLLRAWEQPWAPQARRMLRQTLVNMQRGGIHDHLGGGFARYSVDERWLVPHFEKMLYDNAQLAHIYLWAGIEFEEPEFVRTARTILDYLLRDLAHEDGGIFSAEDADSEGEEGRFYVWDYEEFMEVAGDGAELGRGALRRHRGRELRGSQHPQHPPIPWRTRREVRSAGRSGRRDHRNSPPSPLRTSPDKGSTGPRRQGGGGLERTGDPGTGRGRGGLAGASLPRCRSPGGSLRTGSHDQTRSGLVEVVGQGSLFRSGRFPRRLWSYGGRAPHPLCRHR